MRLGYAPLSHAVRCLRVGAALSAGRGVLFARRAVPVGEGLAKSLDVGAGGWMAGGGVGEVGGTEPGGMAVRAHEDGAEVGVRGAGGADGGDSIGPGGGCLADRGGC